MKKISLYFGSSSGNVETIVKKITDVLGAENLNLYDVRMNPSIGSDDSDCFIFGTSTWGEGELQEDWKEWIYELERVDLSGKKVALFGLGDQEKYSDTFADGLSIIYDVISGKGCEIIGEWEDENYKYTRTRSLLNGKWLGLVVDEDNQSDLSDERVKKWCGQVREKMLSPQLEAQA